MTGESPLPISTLRQILPIALRLASARETQHPVSLDPEDAGLALALLKEGILAQKPPDGSHTPLGDLFTADEWIRLSAYEQQWRELMNQILCTGPGIPRQEQRANVTAAADGLTP